MFQALKIEPNLPIQITFNVLIGLLFGPFIGAQLIGLKGYAGLFGGTISIILFTLVLQVFSIRI